MDNLSDFLPEIEGGRGLASQYVLLTHWVTFSGVLGMYAIPLGAIALSGWSGVTFFFVLSGYLLTRLYYPRPKLRPYYLRRIFRTFPLYYLSIPLFVAIGQMKYSLLDLVYAQNYFQSTFSFNPTWTLSIEELFYFLLLVPMFWILRKIGAKRLLVASAVISTAWQYWAGTLGASEFLFKQFPPFLVAYATGAFVALERPKVTRFAALSILFLSLLAIENPDLLTSPLVSSLGWGAFLAWIVSGNGIMASRPMRFLGKISYGVYLFQVPAYYLLGPWLGLLATFALAIGTRYAFEGPLIEVGRSLAGRANSHV